MAVVGPSLGPAVAALLYLLVVFVVSIWLGRGPGLLASVLALVGLITCRPTPKKLSRKRPDLGTVNNDASLRKTRDPPRSAGPSSFVRRRLTELAAN
jgi:hypothetical protein